MFSKIQKVFAWLFSLCFSLVLIGMWGIEHLFNEKLPIADSIKWTESCNYTLPFTVPRYFDALLMFAIPWIVLYVCKKGMEIMEQEYTLGDSLILGGLFGSVISVSLIFMLIKFEIGLKIYLKIMLILSVCLNTSIFISHLSKGVKAAKALTMFSSLTSFFVANMLFGFFVGIKYGLPTGVVILVPSFILIILGLKLTYHLVKHPEPQLPMAIARNT